MADCGGYYLGHPGDLVRFDGSHVGLARGHGPAFALQTSLGGGRRAYLTPRRAPRSWQVRLGVARPVTVDALHHLVTAVRPPYLWVTPWGQVTNLLTPEWSTLQAAALTPAGVVAAADGSTYATSYSTSGATVLGAAAVVPGRPVCAAVYADDGSVVLTWLDAAGQPIRDASTAEREAITGTILADETVLTDDTLLSVGAGGPVAPVYPDDRPGLSRRWAAAMVPAGAAFVRTRVEGATRVAAPSVTWTSAPQGWGIGDGAARVVVQLDGDEALYAVPDSADLVRHDVALTVHEVSGDV